jgi:hypothetical protein
MMAEDHHWTFPRTMKKGVFAGRTFATQKDYQQALADHRVNGNPPMRRRPRSQVDKLTVNATTVRKIVETYDTLRQEGIGKEKSINVIATLL